jgi:hypothetical protein
MLLLLCASLCFGGVDQLLLPLLLLLLLSLCNNGDA